MTEKQKALLEEYGDPVKQLKLSAIETADAITLLNFLHVPLTRPNAIETVKRFLKKHWSDGWCAAGGPSGAPEEEDDLVQIASPKPRAKAKKAGRS